MNEIPLTAVIAWLGINTTLFWVLFAIAAAASLVLKGFSLWYAARNDQRYWFFALLIVNTFGLLEIVYLIWFRRDKLTETQSLFDTPEVVSSPSA